MNLWEISDYLHNYDGPSVTFMEVCGSHTAAISKFGIKDILSDKIRLISGPGCPVCVTPSAYIDRLIEIAKNPGYCVASFGDMLRVPGSSSSLNEAKGEGARVVMVYSPMDIIDLAQKDPSTTYVFAAVGFETTAPVYTILLDEVIKLGLSNVKVLTALKTMPNVIRWLLDNNSAIDGFIAPGHVCAITGSNYFMDIAKEYKVPLAVSGFDDQELLIAIYGLLRMVEEKEASVRNFYTSVVEEKANETVKAKIHQYFTSYDAYWRGMGPVKDSGLVLREEYGAYDMGSINLSLDIKHNKACSCGEILMGKKEPKDCPLFRKVCNPQNPQGACMVSYEGACYHSFLEG